MKKENNEQNEKICYNGTCGCSVTYIWLGVAVILFVMAAAVMLGK